MEKKIYAHYIKEGMELKTVWGFMEVTDVEVITWNEVSPYTGRTLKCAKTIVTVNNTKTNMDKFTFPLVEMVYVRIPEVKETKEVEVAEVRDVVSITDLPEVTVAKVDEVVTIEVPVADAVDTTNAIADAKMEKAKMEQEIGHPFNTEDTYNYIEQHPVFKDKPYYIKAYIDDCLTGDQGNLDHIYSKEVDLDTCKIWVRLADAELDKMYHRGECSPTKSQYKCMGTGKE